MPQPIRPLKTGLNVASPWIFVGFTSYPLQCMCLTKVSNVLATSYSFWSNQHDIINIVDQYYIWMLQVSSDYIMTEDRRVSRALRKKKNYKCILLSFVCKYELLMFHYDRVRKKTQFPNQQLITRYLRPCHSSLAKILYLTAAALMSLFDSVCNSLLSSTRL